MRAELKQVNIPQSAIAVEVIEVGKHTPLITINSARPMNPASTMKLLTTYAGMELLGPAYSWKTEAWLDGKLDHGVLQGDLVLKGYGDPKFTIEQFWLWLTELRARGLREIRGDLVLDRSFFDLPAYDPADFDNDPVRAYNVGPDALLFNFNTLRLRYLPDGDKFKVISEPALDGITLDNQLISQPATGCSGWDDTIQIQPSEDSIVLQGGYPINCGEREHNLSVIPHTRYVEGLFRTLWQELGGKLLGKSRDGDGKSQRTIILDTLFRTVVGSHSRHQQVQQQCHGPAIIPDTGHCRFVTTVADGGAQSASQRPGFDQTQFSRQHRAQHSCHAQLAGTKGIEIS